MNNEHENMPVEEATGSKALTDASNKISNTTNKISNAAHNVSNAAGKVNDFLSNRREKKNEGEKEENNIPEQKPDANAPNANENNPALGVKPSPIPGDTSQNNNPLAPGANPKNKNQGGQPGGGITDKIKKPQANSKASGVPNPALGVTPPAAPGGAPKKDGDLGKKDDKKKKPGSELKDKLKGGKKERAKKGFRKFVSGFIQKIKKLPRQVRIIILIAIGIAAILFILYILLMAFLEVDEAAEIGGGEEGTQTSSCYTTEGSGTSEQAFNYFMPNVYAEQYSSKGSLSSFISHWEGATSTCTTSNGKVGYLAEPDANNQVAIGGGITVNGVIRSAATRALIDQKGWGSHFRKDSNGEYYLVLGDCVEQSIINEITENDINNNRGTYIDSVIASVGIEMTQFQRDALISYSFNCGSGKIPDIVEGYKNGSYAGAWAVLKECHFYKDNATGELVDSAAHRKRRKAEMALFVTGDYTDKGLFYSRSNAEVMNDTLYNNYNSENLMASAAVCALNLGGDGLQKDPETNYMMRMQRPSNNNKCYYEQDATNYGVNPYEGECAFYANLRAREILATAGTPTTIDSHPNGGEYCSSAWAANYPVSYNVNKPKQGSIISWTSSSYGHVAIVEKVNKDGSIIVSEMGLKIGKLSDDRINYIWYRILDNLLALKERKKSCRDDEGANGCFQTRTLTKDQIYNSGWNGYAFKCYIYLLDN